LIASPDRSRCARCQLLIYSIAFGLGPETICLNILIF
jgi:hypothetical protein